MRRALRSRTLRAATLGVTVLLAMVVAPAPAQAPRQPTNDNYLQSAELNQFGSVLNRTDTLRDVVDTTTATVQSDILNPNLSGGPPEPTTCNGVNEGKTVWYDFYPDINGGVRIRTGAAFDTVIAIMPFNRQTLLPDLSQRQCVVHRTIDTQELDPTVKAGQAYTVQVGGVNAAGGTLEFLFDFIPTFPRLQADATLVAQPIANGIQIVRLNVTAPRRSRIRVECTRGCSTQAKTARNLSFPRLHGASLPAGGKLKIFVTAKNSVGDYIQYAITRGNFVKTTRCLKPGTRTPENCP